MKDIARLLEKIRMVVLPYLVTKQTKDKPWHWHQQWAKTRLLILGEELGYQAYPEYPCYNPEARSRQGRIDVVWGKDGLEGFIPEVAIEISKGVPRRRDIAKLSTLIDTVLCVAVSLSASRHPRIWEAREQKAKSLRKQYAELPIDRIWFIRYQDKPQLLSAWLGIERVESSAIEVPKVTTLLYCDPCKKPRVHGVVEQKHKRFARWKCSACGKVRPGPHPSRLSA